MAKKVIQMHHISYDPEYVVPVFKGEHWAITNLDRRKQWSLGFVLHMFDRLGKRMKMHTIVDLDFEVEFRKRQAEMKHAGQLLPKKKKKTKVI